MSFENPNIDSSVLSAWELAETSCYNYLAYCTGGKAGVNCFIGDDPDESTKINVWAFMLSGGPEQTHNFQCKTPNRRFLCNGILQGVYKKRGDALAIAGLVMNGLPVYRTEEEEEDPTFPNRGLEPNVQFLEIAEFPECFSVKEDNKNRVWILNMFFRCAFNDAQF